MLICAANVQKVILFFTFTFWPEGVHFLINVTYNKLLGRDFIKVIQFVPQWGSCLYITMLSRLHNTTLKGRFKLLKYCALVDNDQKSHFYFCKLFSWMEIEAVLRITDSNKKKQNKLYPTYSKISPFQAVFIYQLTPV
jgi:hypothetical protein